MRRWTIRILVLAGLAVYGWLAVQVYRSKVDPEGFQAWEGSYSWIVGPPSRSLNEVADERLQDALRDLQDVNRPPAERIGAYREKLRTAERLLVRSLRAQPAQADALAKLAAVRWELDPPRTEEDQERISRMIRIASEMAPTVPRVQKRLGELLVRMGRSDDGIEYIRRAVELSPGDAADAVETLRSYALTAEEIREALPAIPEVFAALYFPYRSEDALDRYTDVVEPHLTEADESLLYRYGTACLQLGSPERLRSTMHGLAFPSNRETEAARLRELSRAEVRMALTGPATDHAREAVALMPDRPGLVENLGNVLLAAGDADGAIRAYRSALAGVARMSENPSWRARIYSRIGRAEDARRRPDLAYDAYKKALELDPEDEYAARRIREMREAAGLE